MSAARELLERWLDTDVEELEPVRMVEELARALAPVEHMLTMATQLEPRQFRAECSCGWVGAWGYTNACMGRGKRHVSAMRRRDGGR
jgi:hypothetical protein